MNTETGATPPETATAPPPVDPPEAEAGKEKKKQKEKKSGGAALFLVLLLALAGLAGAAYAIWLIQQSGGTAQTAAQRTEQLAAELDALPARLESALQTEVARLQEAAAARDQKVAALRARVDRSTRELAALTTADRTDWMLAEVEYLMRLANQRVLMEDDLESADVILQAADRILLELDDSRLHPVRAALARDLAAVRAAGTLDIEGLFLRLAAARNQIEGLPLVNPGSRLAAAETPEEAPPVAEASGDAMAQAGAWLEAAWQQLREMVVIRHRDQAVQPLLPPTQEYYLRQNLAMLIEQAQLGLLRSNDAIYQESLAAADRWLAQYFPADATEVKGLRETIAEARKFDVGPRRPDIARGLRVLQDQQSARHWKTPSRAGQPGNQP